MKQLPINLNSDNPNITSIGEYLAGYDKAISIYNGNYTAPWLLSEIHGKQWVIKTKKTIKNSTSNGELKFKYTKSINWDRTMPDGTSLCDDCNVNVLRFYQKVLFILVESDIVMPSVSIASLSNLARSLFNFIPWTFKVDIELNTKSDVLKRLTQKRLEVFISGYMSGGLFKIIDCAKIIIRTINKLSNNKIDDQNRFKLNDSEVHEITNYFKKNELYADNKSGLKYIERRKLLELCGICKSMAYDNHLALFLRQFEPDYIKENPDVLLPLNLEYELPGHTTPLLKDIENKSTDYRSGNNLITMISEILKLKPLFPEFLPSAESFKFDKLYKYSRAHGSSGDVTSWIPLPIFIFSLNKSIDFLMNKGDSILDCIEEIYTALINENLLVAHDKSRGMQSKRAAIIKGILSNYYSKLNVSKLYENSESYKLGIDYVDRVRERTSLYYLIKILKAACYIIIASLKPIRVNEIASLKRDCLFHKENDGYWLMQDMEKAGIDGILPEDAKPIPFIAARAICLLQRFNSHAQSVCPSTKESKYLLYTLNYGSNGSKASIDDHGEVRTCLNIFCDYFEMPTDKYGRRWYINTHELRKSFLLNFFWVFKYSSLDACRWIAGHSNPEHIFQYIEANLPGEEMVEVEAEYAAQQLRLFSSDNKLSDIQNIEELNLDVCKHFNVKSLTQISHEELNEWLTYGIKSGKYEIYAYGIETDTPLNSATVAVKVI